MQEWSDSIKIAIDVIVACVLISCLIGISLLGRQIMSKVDSDRAAAATLQEQRTAIMYESGICYPQDITALVLKTQGNPAVVVYGNTSGTGTPQSKWCANAYYDGSTYISSGYTTEMNSVLIANRMSVSTQYKCRVIYDANGSIVCYKFMLR